MAHLDDTAIRLMARQFGLITRPQVLRCGYPRVRSTATVRRRNLEAVLCGTYRFRESSACRSRFVLTRAGQILRKTGRVDDRHARHDNDVDRAKDRRRDQEIKRLGTTSTI